MEVVAIDAGWLVESDFDVVERDLGGETPDRRGDFGDRYESAHVQHLGAGQHDNGTHLATHLRQPDLSSGHSSPHDFWEGARMF